MTRKNTVIETRGTRGRRKRAGLHLLADEKSELALSRMGGAGARLWQSNARRWVEGPPSASARSLRADSEIARGFAGAVSARIPQCQGGLSSRFPVESAGDCMRSELIF